MVEITTTEALKKGIEAHKAGKAQEANHYYTAILKADPKHPDANHNMGVLAVGVGKVGEALPFLKTALEINPNIAQYWLSYINALIKLDRMADAKAVFDQAKSKGVQGDGFDQIYKKLSCINSNKPNVQDPPQAKIQSLIKLYEKNEYQKVLTEASKLLLKFPKSARIYNIIGTVHKRLGMLEKAIEAYKKALAIKPNYAKAFYNMGNTLQDQEKLEKALSAYQNALSVNPDYAEAYNNMGNALRDLIRPEDALKAYRKAASLQPNSTEIYNNIGNTLRDQGKLEESIKAYNKTLLMNSNYAEAYNNMGVALQDLGKLDDAIEAYNKALSIKPDYAEAHRNLSLIKKYTENDNQINEVRELYKQEDLSDNQKCNLSFALVKMYEDIGDIDKSFAFLNKGNSLRKKLLNYSIDKDRKFFNKLQNAQPYLYKTSLDEKAESIEKIPIFILGMPRSGTTLVEQIISSHSDVHGGGELIHVSKLGLNLSVYPKAINTAAISEFRKMYLSEVSKLSNGKQFVIDKMPQNFCFIPLICAAFPEAKIVHVQRSAAAICWSNYKHYFTSRSNGYCYDLKSVVEYYNLYTDMMKLWQLQYSDRIYDLDYEKLTIDQENQTRKLVNHLGLNWQDACLSPHKNKRSVRTASQQQVRQKVYRGSSEAWRKYEPYLNGAFDSLPS